MVLRIHFTGDDLARTRIAPGCDAMWEVMLSLYRLRRREGAIVFSQWKKDALAKAPAATRMLTTLVPTRGYAVDFLTPRTERGSIAAGAEALRRTPRERLRMDLVELSWRHPGRRLPGWLGGLAAGGPRTLDAVAGAAEAYFEACLSPYWPRIRAQVAQERSRRGRVLVEGGWEAVLSTLHPSARWSFPTLELSYPADHDIHLHGRGLVLQPSFFCRRTPITLRDPELPPVLVYPIEHDPAWAHGDAPGRRPALTGLLGPTRAQVLETIAHGDCTTGELARQLDIPGSTASRQATTLREAGLVTSHRLGQAVVHTVTDLGAALLDGRRPGLIA
ncbi:ArsR/SmtB family transcription factor [Nonomuraea rhodomycinica]|uniref:ArsR/SmtB family transcription factor n=1 Tax=Nonomuraea rhodomycinica TaxID=1712872 RepID=UPI001C37B566|nr:helix-turn-helix domain-containing protein [Nonomuraea rhodomycinica]